MAQATAREQEAGSIEALLTYTVDTGVKPVNETMGPGNLNRRRTGKTQQHAVIIRDGRPLRGEFTLEENGFEFIDHETAVKDFFDADEAEALLERRFAIVQVWRPIRHPIQSDPLAICDARSLAPGDLIAAERRYPDRVGETYRISYNPDHRWFYFPNMRRNEALVFKVYDSEKDGRARFTAHTSFDDPTGPPDAPRRESIEMHLLVFYDGE